MTENLVSIKKNLDKCEKFILPVTDVRTFNECVGTENEQITIQARVEAKDVPLDIWMETNPREQNFNTNVARKILESLLDRDRDNFHLLNRGVLVSAYHAKIIVREEKKYVEFFLKDIMRAFVNTNFCFFIERHIITFYI